MKDALTLIDSVVTDRATVSLSFDKELERYKVQSERRGINFAVIHYKDEDEAKRAFKARVVMVNKLGLAIGGITPSAS